MVMPSWQDKAFGGRIRAALWLETEVGEGEIFTKAALRKAFPDVAQIDRRVRELRDYGWQIDTNRDDPALKLEEQRYVSRGAEIWKPGQAKLPKHKTSLSKAERDKVFMADNFLCRTCGIGVGEVYDGGVATSKLGVTRRKVRLADGTTSVQLVTECDQCRAGAGREIDLGKLLGDVKALAPLERTVLVEWITADRRERGQLEKLWGMYRTLPEESREAFIKAVTGGEGE
ncbi:hypothetical protein [Streptomyces morookaense]|uniref:HNH endonuclease n=1 Tax=Streptomyces morookaense TaxID=1970 RepID=A0A7Y7B9R6_STRMO|nr:hypothetical protein [Streptomyces morookaense]NVK81444.1 hypothetical protein [Streptomyces morookaense]GHF25087.1 hypothetical protein GCM10010359_28850 [Streptomyces morookaense]